MDGSYNMQISLPFKEFIMLVNPRSSSAKRSSRRIMLLSWPAAAILLFSLVLLLPSICEGFVTGSCFGTPQCLCKWSEGKRVADCSNQKLLNIPTTLTPDIQTLILDGNPLRKLDKDAFKTVGLLNIQSLSLRNCKIEYLDDNAFRDLKIMTSLDLSHNNITKIFPKTFDGNDNLKTMGLSHNPIVRLSSYQFPPLNSVKTIDISHCALEQVDKTAFKNLGGSVESVLLDNNNLQSMKEEVFVSLNNLKHLTLHTNPWVCDCKLKNFRDYVVNKKLYNRPTSCSEPSRLYEKMWDDISAAEFACKPEISIPYPRVFGAPNVDATLSCHIMGSPVPQARWVVKGRIVNNNTHPAPFADQTWILREERLTFDGVERWYNLTITNPDLDDLGEYLCVAENNGGVMEKKVTLTFDDPATFGTGIPISDEQLTIIIGVSVAICLLFILLILICCCCFCRQSKHKEAKDSSSSRHSHHNGYSNGKQDSQKLLPNNHHSNATTISGNGSLLGVSNNSSGSSSTLPKRQNHHPSHGEYHGLPQTDIMSYVPGDKYDLEMHDLRAPSVISNKPSTTGSSGSDGGRTTASIGRASFAEEHGQNGHPQQQQQQLAYPPDLLVIKQPNCSISPGLSVQHLMHQHHHSSPFTRSGTLPLPHHRSVSCDHSASSSPIPHFVHQPMPVIHHHHHHPSQQQVHMAAPQQQVRPGYVTLPRRPRASWSVPRDQPGLTKADREPIYDGIGPRTSADGSSRLNLNKSMLGNGGGGGGHQVHPQPAPRYTLPPYYAPIEEGQECPPTPKAQQAKMHGNLPKSTPNFLDLALPKQHKPGNANGSIATSSSETTLLEENISGYCEPFGKAVMPSEEELEKMKKLKKENRNSVTSAESELDLILPKKNKKEDKKKGNNKKKQPDKNESLASNGFKSSTPLRLNGHNGNSSSSPSQISESSPPTSNGNAAAKKAPKTLPKPKVKPVPPPKPKKSFQENGAPGNPDSSNAPLIAFQDESVDGSEV